MAGFAVDGAVKRLTADGECAMGVASAILGITFE